jgi:hypothetical protein
MRGTTNASMYLMTFLKASAKYLFKWKLATQLEQNNVQPSLHHKAQFVEALHPLGLLPRDLWPEDCCLRPLSPKSYCLRPHNL